MSEEGGVKTFGQALSSLLSFDCVRLTRLTETAQYAAIYAFLALFIGVGLDTLHAKIYPVKNGNIETWPQFWGTACVMIVQVISSAITVFYIRKIAQLFPVFINFCPSRYHSGYHVPERVGEIAIALVYVGAMGTLLSNMDRMRCFLSPSSTCE